MSMSQNDVKRALLGDHEAAKRLTDAGVLLKCPFCGGIPTVKNLAGDCCTIKCYRCDTELGGRWLKRNSAIRVWNTRAPILSESELKKLEETT